MILLNNNMLTVHYNGQMYTKEVNSTEREFIKIHSLNENREEAYQEVINLCFPTPVTLLKKEGFWEEDGSLYYKNIKVSIPQVLADKLIEAQGEEFDRLIKFWSWLSLNPNPRTRENLYGWVERNGIQLTNGGLMILYRRVYKVENNKLNYFVKTTYEKLKKQKKGTNLNVYLNEDRLYYVSKEDNGDTLIGNLYFLYHESKEQVFTDAHTRQERYVIGKESWMERTEGDESDSQCSRGYHAGSKDYGFNSFGDTPIAIVVNPMYVLNSVKGHIKMRFTRFTPVAVLNEDCEWIDDPQVHNRIDACYDQGIQKLETLLSEAQFEDFKKHETLTNKWNLQVNFETVLKVLNG